MRFNTAHCWQCSKPLTFFVSAALNSRCSVLNVSSFISNKSGGYALKKETVAWTSKLQTFINFNLFIQKKKVILHDDFEVFTHPQVGFSSLGPEETQGHHLNITVEKSFVASFLGLRSHDLSDRLVDAQTDRKGYPKPPWIHWRMQDSAVNR